ncbi:ATP-binding protein [Arenibacter algicola]|uniref:AlbA family DNA-binding domain-containing protein n=1 Tax=Arenibacter algicola TaxID=616991 RepID=UPI001C06E578|nr:ATP-binding protein [Arenibacter algicola]MBU2905105.1 ATP-binding protein [Arenibacter algicola]
MISESDFENLLKKSESSILDFKEEFYDFGNDSNKSATSKFVKDVISFANTIRPETSYIIFGVRELTNGKLDLIGLKEKYDESILQDKIKDKLTPRPKFSYYSIHFQEKLFGVLEFPIYKYELPIVPSINSLKGLEEGKVYYRNGSSNTEAGLYDIIRINDWLKSLPAISESVSQNENISDYLKELAKGEQKLSAIISELLVFSKKHNLTELKEYCETEIAGIKSNTPEKYQYRAQMVYLSYYRIEINPYSYITTTAQSVKNEFEKSDDFYNFKIVMHQTLLEIESNIDRFKGKTDSTYATLQTNTQALLDMDKKHDLYLYLFYDNFINLYRNIRQKAIDILMKIQTGDNKIS